MSVLTYNGVTVPYGVTTTYKQQAVGDEQSDTDWSYLKFDIFSMGVMNSDYINLIAPDLVNTTTNPAAIMDVVRGRLLQRRKKLSLKVNGIELIPQNGLPGTVDARNGPMPQTCDITQLTDKTFLFNYHIIAYYWEGSGIALNSNGVPMTPANQAIVLYNRWTESIDLDNKQMSVRVRDGKFAIRSDNRTGQTADQVRSQMAIVGIPSGFLRNSSKYSVDPSGLVITYHQEDREVFKMPPAPAFEADGEYTESTTHGGAKRLCEVRVHLAADKLTSQAVLVKTAIGVATQKLQINGAQLGTENTLLEYGSVSVKMYENSVEVRFRVWAPLIQPTLGIGGAVGVLGRTLGVAGMGLTNNFTFTPGSDGITNYTPAYLDRGTASILLEAAAYYDPSLAGVVLDQQTGQMSAGFVPGRAGAALEP